MLSGRRFASPGSLASISRASWPPPPPATRLRSWGKGKESELPCIRLWSRFRQWRSAGLFMRGDMTDRHDLRIESKKIPEEPDQVPPRHEPGSGRDRCRVNPHGKLQIRRTAFVEGPGGLNDAPAVP